MTSNKARLHKMENGLSWEQRIAPYVPYLLLTLILVLMLLIIALVLTVIGVSTHSLTGTEANVYEHMEAII